MLDSDPGLTFRRAHHSDGAAHGVLPWPWMAGGWRFGLRRNDGQSRALGPAQIGLMQAGRSISHHSLMLSLERSQQLSGVVHQDQPFGVGQEASIAAASGVGRKAQCMRAPIPLGKAGGTQHHQFAIVLNHMNRRIHPVAAAWVATLNSGFGRYRHDGQQSGLLAGCFSRRDWRHEVGEGCAEI